MIRTMALILACTVATTASASPFASDFSGQTDRVWIGADYWANPMEDWSLKDGRLLCRGGGNRNVALLTRSLTGNGPFEISVRFGQLQQGEASGTAGLRLGIRDEIDDHRAAALRGKGLDVGVDTRARSLFIGKTSGGALPESGPLNDWTLTISGKPSGTRIAPETDCRR